MSNYSHYILFDLAMQSIFTEADALPPNLLQDPLKEYYSEPYHCYPKHGYVEYAPRHMKKCL